MKQDKQANATALAAFYRHPNPEQNSTIRTLTTLTASLTALGVTLTRAYLQSPGLNGAQADELDVAEAAKVIPPDAPVKIVVEFAGQRRELGLIVNQMRNKETSSSPDLLFDWTGGDSEQLINSLVVNDKGLLDAVNAKFIAMAHDIFKAEDSHTA